MQKLVIIIILFLTTFIMVGCEVNDLSEENVNRSYGDSFKATLYSIGDNGIENYIDICKTGYYSFDVLVDVEVSKDVFERRIYSFVERTQLDEISEVEQEKLECDESPINESYRNNYYYEEENYYAYITQQDAFQPDLIVLDKFDYDNNLIEQFKYMESIARYYGVSSNGFGYQVDDDYAIELQLRDGVLQSFEFYDKQEDIGYHTPIRNIYRNNKDIRNFVQFEDGSFVVISSYIMGPDFLEQSNNYINFDNDFDTTHNINDFGGMYLIEQKK